MVVLGKHKYTEGASRGTNRASPVMMFFPTSPNPQPADMNWSVVMYGFVTIVLLVFYFTRARYSYKGPVVTVRQQLSEEASGNVEAAAPIRSLRCAKLLLKMFGKARAL